MRLLEGTVWDRPPHCDQCGQLEAECQCPSRVAPLTPPAKQTARLQMEKRRKGKVVTVVRGLLDEPGHLEGLLTKLKTACGAGGTVQDGCLEIQGKQGERLQATLQELGYKVKANS